MLRLARKKNEPVQEDAPRQLVDRETGLPNAEQFKELLQRDIARALRYGDAMSLVVFEITVTGFEPTEKERLPPTPAPTVAAVLRDAARQSDLVVRLDEERFAVLLAECNEAGAEQFSSRTRTKLSTSPYARDERGHGVYMRAWAGAMAWEAVFDTAGAYIAATVERMEATRDQLESVQSWYRGVY